MMHDSEASEAARQKAATELARLIFGREAGFSGTTEATGEPEAPTEAPSQAESAPVRSADAGAHGLEPEIPQEPSPAAGRHAPLW